MLLWNEVNQTAVENEKIAPSVVVEIVSSAAPTGVLRGQLRDPRLLGYVGELQLAHIPEQPVVFRIAHPQIRGAAVFGIEENRSHSRSEERRVGKECRSCFPSINT